MALGCAEATGFVANDYSSCRKLMPGCTYGFVWSIGFAEFYDGGVFGFFFHCTSYILREMRPSTLLKLAMLAD